MEHSFKYFKNESCRYFPCHSGMKGEDFNCLFCYCPMNPSEDCPGTPRYINRPNGKKIKDCSSCTFPHEPEHYHRIMEFLKSKNL